MKIRIVVWMLTVLVCAAATAGAQDRQFGLKLGPTFSSLSVDAADEEPGYDTRIGAVFGGFLVLPANPRLALQLEVLVNPKGGKADLGNGVTGTLKFNYFEVPVLMRATVTRSASRAFYVFAGPAAALRSRAEREIASTSGGFNSGVADNISRDIERFEFSAVAGAGMDIGRHLVVDARYSWGLTNVNKNTADGTLKNRALTVLGGYRF